MNIYVLFDDESFIIYNTDYFRTLFDMFSLNSDIFHKLKWGFISRFYKFHRLLSFFESLKNFMNRDKINFRSFKTYILIPKQYVYLYVLLSVEILIKYNV